MRNLSLKQVLFPDELCGVKDIVSQLKNANQELKTANGRDMI